MTKYKCNWSIENKGTSIIKNRNDLKTKERCEVELVI